MHQPGDCAKCNAPAHLSLFHHLPGDRLDVVMDALEAEAKNQPRFSVEVVGLRKLGRGVAYGLVAPLYDQARVAAKVTVLRNTIVGRGCVLGSHAVVKGVIPDYSIAVGAPAKVVKNRKDMWASNAAERAELERALADIERKKAEARGLPAE